MTTIESDGAKPGPLDRNLAGITESLLKMDVTVARLRLLAHEQSAITRAILGALNRSPYDIGVCISCGLSVVTLPDGHPLCNACAEEGGA